MECKKYLPTPAPAARTFASTPNSMSSVWFVFNSHATLKQNHDIAIPKAQLRPFKNIKTCKWVFSDIFRPYMVVSLHMWRDSSRACWHTKVVDVLCMFGRCGPTWNAFGTPAAKPISSTNPLDALFGCCKTHLERLQQNRFPQSKVDILCTRVQTQKTIISMPWRGLTLFARPKERRTARKNRKRSFCKSEEKCFRSIWPRTKRKRVHRSMERASSKREEWEVYRTILLVESFWKRTESSVVQRRRSESLSGLRHERVEARIRNGVVRRLSSDEARRVLKSAIFRLPLRVVRVNKFKDPNKLQAKSPVVIPGHTDPGLGEHPSDSQTTSPTAIRMMKSIAVRLNWLCYAFDVAAGKHAKREREREGLCQGTIRALEGRAIGLRLV